MILLIAFSEYVLCVRSLLVLEQLMVRYRNVDELKYCYKFSVRRNMVTHNKTWFLRNEGNEPRSESLVAYDKEVGQVVHA